MHRDLTVKRILARSLLPIALACAPFACHQRDPSPSAVCQQIENLTVDKSNNKAGDMKECVQQMTATKAENKPVFNAFAQCMLGAKIESDARECFMVMLNEAMTARSQAEKSESQTTSTPPAS